MRKLSLLLLLGLILVSIGANAEEVTSSTTFTTVEQLTENYFTIEINGNLICHTAEGNQNSRIYTTPEVIASYPDHLFSVL